MKIALWMIAIVILVGVGFGCAGDRSVPAVRAPIVPDTSTSTEPAADLAVADRVPSIIAEDIVVPSTDPLSLTMTAGNFFFDPATIVATPGQTITITFTNIEGEHTFIIDELSMNTTITNGSIITFTAPTIPGSYSYFCDVGAHRKLGMEGVLNVVSPSVVSDASDPIPE